MDHKVEIYGAQGAIKVDLTFGANIGVYRRTGYSCCIEKADNTLGWPRPAVEEFYNLGCVDKSRYALDCVMNKQAPK